MATWKRKRCDTCDAPVEPGGFGNQTVGYRKDHLYLKTSLTALSKKAKKWKPSQKRDNPISETRFFDGKTAPHIDNFDSFGKL